MKVKITQVNAYEIEIDGVVHKGFEKKGEIEDVASFKNSKGQSVLVCHDNESGMPAFFDRLFGQDEKTKEFAVLRISPDLIPVKDKKEDVE